LIIKDFTFSFIYGFELIEIMQGSCHKTSQILRLQAYKRLQNLCKKRQEKRYKKTFW